MYNNLITVMKIKNISFQQIAELLGCKYQTVSDKVKGNTKMGLTYDEARKIKTVFFPEYDMEYLYEKEKESA